MKTNQRMRTLTTTPLFLFTALVLLLSSCANLDQLVESGNYDQAIATAQRKLVGKKNKNPQHVQALEQAFQRATERDLAQAKRLEQYGDDADWGQINAIYRKIRRRQEALAPLLPLIDKNGYQATFQFVRTADLEEKSSQQAAAYHYKQALDYLAAARRGDRAAGREAYSELKTVQQFERNYRSLNQLLPEAEALGIVHVLVEMANESQVLLPEGFARELLRVETAPMNSQWRRFHTRSEKGQEYDYQARLTITQLDVSPERVVEREYTDEKAIEDGFDYVLDENGNVKKDSLGNDIKVPKEVEIQAFVFEAFQQKFAVVTGRMELFNTSTNALVDSQQLTAEARFEHRAATFRGDERALSKESRQCIGNEPLPFPSDEALLLQAATRLKPILQEHLARYSPMI